MIRLPDFKKEWTTTEVSLVLKKFYNLQETEDWRTLEKLFARVIQSDATLVAMVTFLKGNFIVRDKIDSYVDLLIVAKKKCEAENKDPKLILQGIL